MSKMKIEDIEKLALEIYPINRVEVSKTLSVDSNALLREGAIKGFQSCQELNEDNWISIVDNLPNEGKRFMAYFDNGKIDIMLPFHKSISKVTFLKWKPLPPPPTK